MEIVRWLKNNAAILPEEVVAKIAKLTRVKEIYRCWETNDDGEDLTFYTAAADEGETPRYFLKHYSRSWNGGWSYDETTTWYELSEQTYLQLYAYIEK